MCTTSLIIVPEKGRNIFSPNEEFDNLKTDKIFAFIG